MNYAQLNDIFIKENAALQNLLDLMEQQHRLLLNNEVFELDSIVDKISAANKAIAAIELERRGILNGKSLKDTVAASQNDDLDDNYRKAQRLVHLLQIQKNSNEQLIKSGLAFSSKMLMFLNPDRNTKVYNSYGKMKR